MPPLNASVWAYWYPSARLHTLVKGTPNVGKLTEVHPPLKVLVLQMHVEFWVYYVSPTGQEFWSVDTAVYASDTRDSRHSCV